MGTFHFARGGSTHASRALCAVFTAALVLAACGGGNDVAGQTGIVPVSSVAQTGLIAGAKRSGSAVLPAGVSRSATGPLVAVNSLGTTPVAASGAFTLDTVSSDAQFASIQTASGASLLMGWLGASEPAVDVHTTAELYLYFATFAYTLPDATSRAAVIASIQAQPGLSSIEQAITAALVAHPKASPATDAGVQAAIASLAAALSASSAMPSHSADGLKAIARVFNRRRDALTVMPGSASGIDVIQSDTSIQFQNSLRREAAAYVDEISHVDATNTTIKDQVPDTNPPVAIAPVAGIGSFLGSISDYLKGNYALVPTLSAAVETPNVSGAKSTLYRAAVVGPGVPPGDYALLTDIEKEKVEEEFISTLISEVTLPLIATVLVPNAKIGPLEGDLANSLVKDTIATLASDARVKAAAENGDAKTLAAVVTADIVQSATLTEQLCEAVVATLALAPANQLTQAATLVAKTIGPALAATDGGIALIDALAIIKDEAAANKADIFMITATDPTTTLTPSSSNIAPLASVMLTAAVHPPETNLVVYQYATSGTYGTLTDASGNPDHVNNFTSSYATVTYTGGASGGGSDTITVTPIVKVVGQPDEDLSPAHAVVSVGATPTPSPTPTSGTNCASGGVCGTATVVGSYDGGPNAGQAINVTETVALDGRSQNNFGASIPAYFAGSVTIDIPNYYPGQQIVDGTSKFSGDDDPCPSGLVAQSGAGGHTFTAQLPVNGQAYSLPSEMPGYGCGEYIYPYQPQNQGYMALNLFYGAFPPSLGAPGSYARSRLVRSR